MLLTNGAFFRLVKFIEMNQDLCDMAMAGVLSDKLAFKTNKEEHKIVTDSLKGDKPLLLIGRSGTGKTTVAMKRMALKWQLCHEARYPWHGIFITANGVLVNEVREVFRARQLGAAGGHTADLLPETVILPVQLHRCTAAAAAVLPLCAVAPVTRLVSLCRSRYMQRTLLLACFQC
eukprot:SAG31_NODE_5089_length_2749_cov_1.514717_4_plen_175_part_01